MAPEQSIDTHKADQRADIYSLGCTFCYLLTGRPVYEGDTLATKILAHREERIPSLAELRPDIPTMIDSVFQKMVAKSPDQRHASMTEVLADLERCRSEIEESVEETVTYAGRFAAEVDTSNASHEITGEKADADSALDRWLHEELPEGPTDFIAKPRKQRKLTQRKLMAGLIIGTVCLAVLVLAVVFTRKTPNDTPPVAASNTHTEAEVLNEEAKTTDAGKQAETRETSGKVSPGPESVPERSSNGTGMVRRTASPTSEVPSVPAKSSVTVSPHEWSWSEPVNLGPPVNTEWKEEAVYIAPDQLTLLFASNRPGGFGACDLWLSERTSIDEPFREPENLGPPVNGGSGEFGPYLSVDKLTLLFCGRSDPFGDGTYLPVASNLWMTTRRSVDQPFDEPAKVGPQVNSAYSDERPYLTPDGLSLFFSSDRPGGVGSGDIWVSHRASTNLPFGTATNLGPPVNTEAVEGGPSLSADALTLVFHRQVAGSGKDLWMSRRRTRTDPFEEPVHLGQTVNSDEVEMGPRLSGDGKTLYFVSRRPGGEGELDIWCSRLLAQNAQAAPPTPGRQPERPASGTMPALAVAPFTAEQAKQHQEAWAEHLGVPVEQRIDLGDDASLTMVLIPPGEFMMGSSEEEQNRFLKEVTAPHEQWAAERIPTEGPLHAVRITEPFLLGRYEVTRGQFRQFVEETRYKTDAEQDGKGGWGQVDGKLVQDPRFVWNAEPGFAQTDEHPVVNVSWNDAAAFCQWLSDKGAGTFVLPTEAQWEYACRAGTTTFWHSGQSEAELREYAWFRANSGQATHPVGQLRANGFGLYDMHGNVREWCADRWAADYYKESPRDEPSGPPTGTDRLHRGGSLDHQARYCRSAFRDDYWPDGAVFYLGFRVAAVLAGPSR
jgi:formylglycine-generating enzyme required for sulfatase activity